MCMHHMPSDEVAHARARYRLKRGQERAGCSSCQRLTGEDREAQKHSRSINFLPFQKVGRSGDIIVMSHGRSLNTEGHGLNFLDTHHSLPMLSLPCQYSCGSLTSIHCRLVRFSQVEKLVSREINWSITGGTGLKTRANWCIWTGSNVD